MNRTGLILGLILTTAHAHALTPATGTSTLNVAGDRSTGEYRSIRGSLPQGPVELTLERIPNHVNVGGLLIETNPDYDIAGSCPDGTVVLHIAVEDKVSELDGVRVQTGQIVHIQGSIGARVLDLDIEERQMIETIGGVAYQTELWREIVARPAESMALTMKRVVEASEEGGIRIEQGSHHLFEGTDGAAPVALRVDGYDGEEISVTGQGSVTMVTLMLALRPFLALGR